ncbi:MAG TPA: hypothetical protein VF526_18055, partial [Solirubrobacteraceae bacterium]
VFFELTNALEALARLVLLGFLAPHLAPASRIIAAAIQRAGSASPRDESIVAHGENVVVAKSDGYVALHDVALGERVPQI